MKFYIFPFLFFACGCASNSGLVAIGSDTYMVSRQAATGFSGLGTLKADAIKEASDYCAMQDMALKLIGTKEAEPPFILGNFPKAEVQFTCENANIDEPEDPQS